MFDTIDHQILCKKLEYYGLNNDVLYWCKDYLAHRKQCVKIDSQKSTYQGMEYGVPQGSILGPLFFIIYVNDLLSLFDGKKVQILLYADDTVVFFGGADPNVACNTVENSLCTIYDWCRSKKKTVNCKKTKQMLISLSAGRKNVSHPTVKMGEDILENVTVYNYLDVPIDNTLSFNAFLKGKCEKINVCLYQLAKMRKFIMSKIACTIY